MKKMISVILTVFMIIPYAITGYAEKDNIADNVSKELYILNKVGITDDMSDENLHNTVSRAEFVSIVANALNVSGEYDIRYFEDVPSTYANAAKINAMVSLGIISGQEKGYFYPDNAITYEQLCKIVVVAMGYEPFINTQKYGMYAYIKKANELDIAIDNLGANDEIKYWQAIKIIYNAVTAPMAYDYGVKNGNVITRTDKGDDLPKVTILSTYHSVFLNEGQLKAANGKNITDESVIDERIKIDDEYYSNDGFNNPEVFLGEWVEFLYRENKNGEKSIIYIDSKITDYITFVKLNNIESYDKTRGKLEFYENDETDKLSTVYIDKQSLIIENGCLNVVGIGDLIETAIDGNIEGSMEIIKKNGYIDYDIVRIKSYKLFAAQVYDTTKNTIHSSEKNVAPIALDKYDKVYIKDTYGNDTNLGIKFPMPILVSTTPGNSNKSIEIIVLKKIAVSKIIKTDDDKITCDDEKVYTLNRGRKETLREELYLGVSCNAYLDINGEIIYVDTVTEPEMQIGYLINVGFENTTFSNRLKFRFYMQDELFHDYELADNVVLDEIKYKTSDYRKFVLAFPGNVSFAENAPRIERQVMRFLLNSEGKINKIDTYKVTEKEDPETTLRRTWESSNGELSYQSGTGGSKFGMCLLVNSATTKYFMVPGVNSEGKPLFKNEVVGDDIKLYGTNFVYSATIKYSPETYQYTSSPYEDVVVIPYDYYSRPVYNPIIFNNLTAGLDADGNEAKYLNGFETERSVKYEVSDICISSVEALNQGDVIYIYTDLTGKKINYIQKMFDVKTKQFGDYRKNPYEAPQYTGGDRYWYMGTYKDNNLIAFRDGHFQASKMYVYDYDVNTAVLSGSYEIPFLADGKINERILLNSIPVMVYDSTARVSERIHPMEKTDIETYKSSGENCDLAICTARNAIYKFIYIVR